MGAATSRDSPPAKAGASSTSSSRFVVYIDTPPKPPPPDPTPTKRPLHQRAAHGARLAVGKRTQFAPEFGPRGVGGNVALRTVHCGTPLLRGEWWSTPQFEAVVSAYRENFRSGRIRDGRSQLCMYHKGQKVVDAFGDALGKGDDYDRDSLQAIFSCSKLVSAIVFAWLRDRGHIDYNAKVSKYWPEFGSHGKEDVTVSDLLKHDAGIPWLDEKVPGELTVGTERLDELAKLLASQKRLYPAGTRVYHAVIQGPLLNEFVRRADPKGRILADVFRQEIGEPLNVDVYFNLTKEMAAARLANSYEPSKLWTDWNIKAAYATTGCFLGSDQPGLQAVLDTQRDLNSVYNLASRPVAADHTATDEQKRDIFINTPCMCASNGMASARGLAKLGAMLVNGGEVEGVRILKEATVREMCSDLDLRPDAFFDGAEMGWTKGGICARTRARHAS